MALHSEFAERVSAMPKLETMLRSERDIAHTYVEHEERGEAIGEGGLIALVTKKIRQYERSKRGEHHG